MLHECPKIDLWVVSQPSLWHNGRRKQCMNNLTEAESRESAWNPRRRIEEGFRQRKVDSRMVDGSTNDEYRRASQYLMKEEKRLSVREIVRGH